MKAMRFGWEATVAARAGVLVTSNQGNAREIPMPRKTVRRESLAVSVFDMINFPIPET
jgi:hypothetical protein